MTKEIAASRGCLFCAIAAGRAPAYIVYQDDRLVAFLDTAPIRPGHLQIVPRDHHLTFDALPPDLAAAVLHLGQRFAGVQRRLYGVERVGFLFTGGDIPHAHAHVVPLVSAGDITSRRYIAEPKITFQAPPPVREADLTATAQALRGGLAAAAGP
ncbi:MAG: HIT family protein [Kiloniellaceae bacterium]